MIDSIPAAELSTGDTLHGDHPSEVAGIVESVTPSPDGVLLVQLTNEHEPREFEPADVVYVTHA